MNIKKVYQEFYSPQAAVCIDNRKVKEGSIFVAVGQKDERGVHRGCAFAEKALEAGASAVLVNDAKLQAEHADDPRWLWVEDGEKALQDLAREHRKQLDIPIIAVAGSNGKTTTRELIEAVLSQRFKVFSTIGNLNNHLGVPLSLLMIDPFIEIAILEIGANHLEETAFLTNLIQPTIGLLTNNGKDHLGEYGSFENVIKANKELYDYFEESAQGLVLVNAEDVSIMESSAAVPHRIFYGRPDMDEVWAKVLAAPDLKLEIHIGTKGFEAELELFGAFWKSAVLAAVQLGVHFGLKAKEIQKALILFRPASLRSERKKWKEHELLLDCYNANPSSMQAFLKAVQGSSNQPKLLILGEMLELGKYAKFEHQKLLKEDLNHHLYEQILLIGPSFLEINWQLYPNIQHFKDIAAAELAFNSLIEKQPFFIYVKGSRGNQLEKLFK